MLNDLSQFVNDYQHYLVLYNGLLLYTKPKSSLNARLGVVSVVELYGGR